MDLIDKNLRERDRMGGWGGERMSSKFVLKKTIIDDSDIFSEIYKKN